jgi:hypothetical protein
VYPGSENSDVVAVLYAELGKPGFREFHKTLRTLAINQEVTYILRHFVKVREIIIFNRFYLIKKNHNKCTLYRERSRCGHDYMVVGFQLPVQSVPITTKIVSFNPAHGEVYLIKH